MNAERRRQIEGVLTKLECIMDDIEEAQMWVDEIKEEEWDSLPDFLYDYSIKEPLDRLYDASESLERARRFLGKTHTALEEATMCREENTK